MTIKYPNVLVPPMIPFKHLKRYGQDYINARQINLTRFMSYCFNSEDIKSDSIFETFLHVTDIKEYKKTFLSLKQKKIEDPNKLSELQMLVYDQTHVVKCPDPARVSAGLKLK